MHMIQRLKQIFLTQHIGAIVVAIVSAEGFGGVISLILFPLNWKITSANGPTSNILGTMSYQTAFNWTQEIIIIVNVALHFALVLLLMRWLYGINKELPTSHEVASDGSE